MRKISRLLGRLLCWLRIHRPRKGSAIVDGERFYFCDRKNCTWYKFKRDK